MRKFLTSCAALLLAASAASPLLASANETMGAGMADGEIRKVDKDAAKLTIKHGELKSLGMMPMTMVFRVKDAAMLDKAPVGAKVKFQAEKIDGALTVTALEVVQQ